MYDDAAFDDRPLAQHQGAAVGIVRVAEHHASAADDLRCVPAIVTHDGVAEKTDLGAGVADDPVNGVLRLVHRLAAHGRGLTAGSIVLAGGFVRPVAGLPGSRFHAD